MKTHSLEEDPPTQVIVWSAYCLRCQAYLAQWPNGAMVEAAGRLHVEQTGHERFLLGYEIWPNKEGK